jgi:excisionase family DNA binding protein
MQLPPKNPTSSEVIIQQESTEPLWTVDDVALYLRLNPETVRGMARQGKIPCIKVGKSWRFRSNQIKRWLQINVNKGLLVNDLE